MTAMNEHADLFTQLSEQLQQNQDYWRPIAFHQNHLPWMAHHPVLVKKLLSLSLEQIDSLANSPQALTNYLAEDLPFAPELYDLSLLKQLKRKKLSPVSPHFYTGIPGRKWQQVSAFAACFDHSSNKITEWCAGKSYLGFYLQHVYETKVVALEWDDNLVQQANSRAQQHNIELHSHCVDVLGATAPRFLHDCAQVVALHACGELHERLLQLSVATKVQDVQLAPCCYHKRQPENYLPLSTIGRSLDLHLNKNELHTAVMETVTAGATLQRQRKQLQIMRLGFDSLQRELWAKDEYLPIPSLATSWSKAEFSEFCQHCATLKNMTLPKSVDWQYYLQQGQNRFKQVSALDLVRFLFRRPIEVWLALDRALFLEEHGYKVTIGTFCSSHISPRNILIQARYIAKTAL